MQRGQIPLDAVDLGGGGGGSVSKMFVQTLLNVGPYMTEVSNLCTLAFIRHE